MKLTVKAEDKRQYFHGEGDKGECNYTIQAQKISGELVYALISLGDRAGGDVYAELRFNQKYGSKELTPEISFASSSDKSVDRARKVSNAILVAIAIVGEGPAWIEKNIQPE